MYQDETPTGGQVEAGAAADGGGEPGRVIDSIAESSAVQRAGEAMDTVTGGWPAWAQLLALVAVFVLGCVAIRFVAVMMVRRVFGRSRRLARWRPVLERSSRASLVSAIALGTTLALFAASSRGLVPGSSGSLWDELSTISIILALTWLVITLIGGATGAILDRHDLSNRDDTNAQRVHTQLRVLSRALMTIVGIVGVAIALMTFERVERLGASMLASAGIMGIIVGFAARQVLENLLAGVQIALSQPLRLGDTVVIHGEYGDVEEITMTYVVVRVWDQRRLIVPLADVITEAFENWSRTSSEQLCPVVLRLDFAASIDAIRGRLDTIVEGHELYDGRKKSVQVIDTDDRTMGVRILVSARNSSDAWTLRCEVREKMIAFLRDEHPEALPRAREVLLESDPGTDDEVTP